MSAFTLFLLFIYFNPGAALVFQFMNFIEFRLQLNFDTFKRPCKLLEPHSNGCDRIFSLPQFLTMLQSRLRTFNIFLSIQLIPCS